MTVSGLVFASHEQIGGATGAAAEVVIAPARGRQAKAAATAARTRRMGELLGRKERQLTLLS